MGYIEECLADSPAFLYDFAETSGTAVADSSPNARHAAFANTNMARNGASLVPSRPSNPGAVVWQTWIPLAKAAWMTSMSFTLEGFISEQHSGRRVLFDRDRSTGNYVTDRCWSFYRDGATLGFGRHSGGTFEAVVSSGGLDSAAHHFICTVTNGLSCTIHIDNVLRGSGTFANPLVDSGSPMALLGGYGSDVNVGYFWTQGGVDAFSYYPSALSAERREAHFLSAAGLPYGKKRRGWGVPLN